MNSTNFLLGMTAGLVAGTVLGMSVSPSRREIKHAAHKAAKTVTDAVENLTEAMGL